jgi:hypothetical protein
MEDATNASAERLAATEEDKIPGGAVRICNDLWPSFHLKNVRTHKPCDMNCATVSRASFVVAS